MDQEYERRLLRQINHQNLPTEARLSKCGSATCSPVSIRSGDRFIPTRAGSNWSINFHYANENCRSPNQTHKVKDATSDSSKGALAWNGEQLSSGSRDRVILQRDVRTSPSAERRLQGHRQEVCGLKWSPDHQHLASGGNDNKLLVWNSSSLLPVQQYSDHLAAVKAIAWSPHQHGLLASGGGTADRCLRFWNTLTGQALQSTDTGSQVCNLAWSKHANELVSTHGYSQNQVLVWKYPSLTQVAKLTGHSYRVLYLAVSPDGEAIVTGAGDETLRFWNVFSKTRCTKESKSVLNLFTRIR
uniref:Fizzy/cell division cycle 20 related 1b n=1 Tax=Gasterosteus aculeatus aculeatus TaxID=481459 RepID=A0AAQ4R7K0_GASAC